MLRVRGVMRGVERGQQIEVLPLVFARDAGGRREIDAEWRAGDFGLEQAPFSDLAGGDLAGNVAIVEAVLEGRGPRGLVDTIVLNAAVAMWIVGRTNSVREGLAPARELLLAQASDWAFIMKTNTTVEYAKKRTRDHIARFTYLYRALMGEVTLEEPIVREFEQRDNIFPEIDYRVYS